MKKIILFSLMIILAFSYYSANAWYYYPYICDNSNCYDTQLWVIDPNQSWYFLSNETITKISNLDSFVDSKLSWYSGYYWNSKLTIVDYYYSAWNISDKKLTLSDLISINTVFYTGDKSKKYINGKDYLFSNFTSVINELHNGFPIWDKKNTLATAINSNIIGYWLIPGWTESKFWIKNVCTYVDTSSKCDESRYLWVSTTSTDTYYFLKWNRRTNNQFILDVFNVSDTYTISNYLLKAWNSIDFNFWFKDYLDWSKNSTKYEYTISYQYEWWPIVDYLIETIDVSKDFVVSSPNIKPDIIWNIIDLNVIDSKLKRIRVWIKESINFTKPWKVFFYLTAKNLNTGDVFDRTQINVSPVDILPSDNIKSWIAQITTPFSKTINTNWFNIWDTFSVTLSLKDLYWNDHYDYVTNWGYDISLSNWSSSNIELAKVWSSTYSQILTWVQTTTQSPYNVSFKFRINKDWYHDLKWFDIKVKDKKDNYTYSIPTQTYSINNIIPSNLYDWVQLMKIYIKSPTISDFIFTCSKWPIIVSSLCTSDNFSWCNSYQNKSVVYTSESQNWTTGQLSIQDYAYNVKNYNYTMNNIDQTAPVISILKWWLLLNNTSYNYKANTEQLKISFYESTTSVCEAEINYLVKINGVAVLDGEGIWSWIDLIIPESFLSTTWVWKTLYIKATDKYWNYNEKTVSFNIYPESLDISKTTISVSSNWDKYANNSDFYTYTLWLKDMYWNAIYNKNVFSINQNCLWASSWCKSLKTDMINNSWDDALIEFDKSLQTDINWNITFRLSSFSPWDFTQRFSIVMKEWNQYYIDTSSNQEINKDLWSLNSFKKLFKWELKCSKDDWGTWDALPEIWTEMKYKLNISKIPDIVTSGPIISDFSFFVKSIDYDTELQGLSDITKLENDNPEFSARINTATLASSLWKPWVEISNSNNESPIVISYELWWKIISYYLSKWYDWADRTVIDIKDEESSFMWVKIIWTLQWWWKGEFTGQNKNFSDLSTSELRAKIRKNAYSYIKTMNGATELNWVKFVDWQDITISWNPTYETLVVKNGNVIIDWDLNTNWNKLWIIVLKDWYDIKTWFNWKWNVFVKPNVSSINAIIYADWWLISADSSWSPYTKDSTSRTKNLDKQLYMKWTLFTRNTIWWSILAWWYYLLPWWTKTNDFDNAMIYDLNYVRRFNKNCIIKKVDWSCKYKDPFIIEYNSSVQSKPPKLFY